MAALPPLARIRAEMRALMAKNPAWPSDAILSLGDACREAALHCAAGPEPHSAAAFHDIADMAQVLAAIFAPALDQRAEQLALTETALRHGDSA
jgi:hypothetical protein